MDAVLDRSGGLDAITFISAADSVLESPAESAPEAKAKGFVNETLELAIAVVVGVLVMVW